MLTRRDGAWRGDVDSASRKYDLRRVVNSRSGELFGRQGKTVLSCTWPSESTYDNGNAYSLWISYGLRSRHGRI